LGLNNDPRLHKTQNINRYSGAPILVCRLLLRRFNFKRDSSMRLFKGNLNALAYAFWKEASVSQTRRTGKETFKQTYIYFLPIPMGKRTTPATPTSSGKLISNKNHVARAVLYSRSMDVQKPNELPCYFFFLFGCGYIQRTSRTN